jgi:putative SOS response-associated peptidase YedK
MCYDISFTVDLKQLSDYFPDLIVEQQLEFDFEAGIHVIGHNYGEHPIIYRARDTMALHCRPMEWGCIPYYVKDESSFIRQRPSMLNARSERILADSKSYWYKIRNRRCLIPVSGVYEHRAIAGWKKKVPYFITLKEQPLFFLPALYSVAELVDHSTGELIKTWTFALITTDANGLMKQIHNDGDNKWRMPLFLPRDLSLKFLDEELSTESYSEILQYRMPSSALECWPVFTIRGQKPRPDLKRKNEPWTWEGLPGITVDES